MSDDPLAPLRARFMDRCVDDRATLCDLLGQDAISRHEALRLLAHRLSGIAGSFGHPSLSRLAAQIDDELVQGRPAVDEQLSALIGALDQVIAASSGAGDLVDGLQS